MPRGERQYRVVLDAQAPQDLAARCSETWRDLLEVVGRRRKHQHLAERNEDRRLTGSHDTAVIETQQGRSERPVDESPGR